MLLSLFGIFTVGNIVWIVYMFLLFSGCPGNVVIMICTCVIALIIYGVVLLQLRKDASIFTSSLVVSYCLYLQWSALSSDYNGTCNPFAPDILNNTHNPKANTITMMVFGLIFTFSALMVVGGKGKAANEED